MKYASGNAILQNGRTLTFPFLQTHRHMRTRTHTHAHAQIMSSSPIEEVRLGLSVAGCCSVDGWGRQNTILCESHCCKVWIIDAGTVLLYNWSRESGQGGRWGCSTSPPKWTGICVSLRSLQTSNEVELGWIFSFHILIVIFENTVSWPFCKTCVCCLILFVTSVLGSGPCVPITALEHWGLLNQRKEHQPPLPAKTLCSQRFRVQKQLEIPLMSSAIGQL